MLKMTRGNSLSASSATPSCMRLIPCPHEPVAALAPVAAAPSAMLMASSSLSALMHTPRRRELLRHVLQKLGEGQHRVAGEETATGHDGGLGHRFAALHETGRHV